MRPITCRLLLCSCFIINSLAGYAQTDLKYRMEVEADPGKGKFNVSGSLSFLTAAHSPDIIELVLSKGNTSPVFKLLNKDIRIIKTDTSHKTSGDIVYQFRLSKSLAAGSMLRLEYAYERGAAGSFQYFIDSNFCMAGGYGSAWYPQLNTISEDGSKKCSRGAGTIRVTVDSSFTPVMAASTQESIKSGTHKTVTFTYSEADIFSLYIGHYSTHHYKGTLPFYTYILTGSIYNEVVPIKSEQVLSFLRTQFGPLKIPNFSIIEFPDYVSEQMGIGGASILGGIVMPGSAISKFNYALFGHELSHQWWGNLILAKDEREEAMLSEGMAQYGSLQVVRHFDPEHALDYRKTGYPGYIKDQSGLGYLKNAAAGNDEPLIHLTGSNDHTLADSKGFLVLELLSETVGKQKFNKALQEINTRHRQSGLSWKDFTTTITQAHGSSLDWFFRQWFEQTGAPEWQTEWQQQGNEVMLTLTQTGKPYQLPVELLITYENGARVLKQMEVSESVSHLKIPVTGKVRSIQTDPYFKIIHWDEVLKPEALAMSKLAAVQKLRMEQQPEAAEKLALAYIDSLSQTDKYGLEFSLLYALGRMKGMQQKPGEALAYYKKALSCASRNKDYLAYTYYRIAQIAAGQKDKTLFDWSVQQAIKADELNQETDHIRAMTEMLIF